MQNISIRIPILNILRCAHYFGHILHITPRWLVEITIFKNSLDVPIEVLQTFILQSKTTTLNGIIEFLSNGKHKVFLTIGTIIPIFIIFTSLGVNLNAILIADGILISRRSRIKRENKEISLLNYFFCISNHLRTPDVRAAGRLLQLQLNLS